AGAADHGLSAPADAPARRRPSRRRGLSMRKASWLNVVSVALGLAFLYLPIVILVIYSFNASRLVGIWGGWSTRWYAALLADQGMRDSAWISLRIRGRCAPGAAPSCVA